MNIQRTTLSSFMFAALAAACATDSGPAEGGAAGAGKGDGAESDCAGKLLEGFSRDSALHTVAGEDLGADGAITLGLSRGAIAHVGAELGCAKDDPALAVTSEAKCTAIRSNAPWTKVCYLPTGAGYFMVSMDFVDTVNVLYNRWD